MEELSVISLTSGFFSGGEGDGTVLITVERTGKLASEVSFNYSNVNGVAEDGADFIASSGTLTFGANQDLIEIPVSILEDSDPEIDETFSVLIGAPSPGAELGSIRTGIITIEDNDEAPPNTVNFSQPEYTVSEDGGSATITVTRSGDAALSAQVQYTTIDDFPR